VAEAPDAVTAVRAGRAHGSRVEVAGLRTELRSIFAEPDGTMTAEVAAAPVRVRPGSSWERPDTTLVRRADGSARSPALAGIRLGLRTDGPRPRTTKDGGIEARNRAGVVVFATPASKMWDAGRTRRHATAAVSLSYSLQVVTG
jgi:hypothetical protein